MTKGSDNPFPSVLLTEGGPPSAPASGKQRLWVNSSNLNMITAAGVQRVIGAAAAGGGGVTVPIIRQVVRTNGTATITAIASGRRLIVAITSFGGTVTGVACTNVTFTQIGSDVSQGGNKTSVWVGVATATSGTSVTFTGNGTIINIVAEVSDALTPTLDAQGSATTAAGFITQAATIAATAGSFVVVTGHTDNSSVVAYATLSTPHTPVTPAVTIQATSMALGYAPDSGDTTGVFWSLGGSSGAMLVVSIV